LAASASRACARLSTRLVSSASRTNRSTAPGSSRPASLACWARASGNSISRLSLIMARSVDTCVPRDRGYHRRVDQRSEATGECRIDRGSARSRGDEHRRPWEAPPLTESSVDWRRDRMVHALRRRASRSGRSPRAPRRPGPASAGGRPFVGSNDGRVYRLDLASGKIVWDYEAASPVTSSPAVAKGTVVIATADGQVMCFGSRQMPTVDSLSPQGGNFPLP
jgi:hypothetical protein